MSELTSDNWMGIIAIPAISTCGTAILFDIRKQHPTFHKSFKPTDKMDSLFETQQVQILFASFQPNLSVGCDVHPSHRI